LHHAGIIHRDLKPENLLLHSELEESDSSSSPSKKKRIHSAGFGDL
jgi:serine/threonine protein kinase